MLEVNLQIDLKTALHGCSSWQDITTKWSVYSEKQKGDLFEDLVKAYLQLEPEYASKLKHVWLQREVPQAITRKLKLPATDQGIDIVAETHDGEFWAIQCKYRQETDHSLTWRDLSTFTGLAFGVCREFSFGIICSTTERITNVLKNQENIGFCALDVWQTLDADFLKRIRAHLSHKEAILKPLHPRPHQKPAIKDAHQHFVIQKATRGKLIMPCGSGKSLTAWWIAEKLKSQRIVIAVPSLALIRQTLKVWLRETMANKQSVEWICVCSDESAGRVDRDDTAVLRQDLGVPCLTDPTEIAAWLKRKHHGLTVVFTTYQSGETLAKAARAAKFSFDLGIMDEAHKTVGDGEKLFSHLLHDKNLKIQRRFFMTATERRYKGQSDTVLSMDDTATYGETFHLLSFKRAMEFDPPILSDYKIISIAVSREEVAELIRKNTFVRPDKGTWSEEIEADMLASLIALRKAMKKYPIRHAVSFHGSIQRAELFKIHNDAFSKSFRSYGKLETFHVSGKTPTGTRARVIGEFAAAERALITNARCLTEGVDVPGIDCVLFADPRRSAVDIVQAVGRALRPAPDKQFGYVIVPILHEADATADEIFNSDSFKEILTTLRALAANDDRIIEYFRGVSQGRQRKGGGSVQFDIDERLAKRINLDDFSREIELKCWDRLAKLSWRPFEEAREFANQLGLKSFTEWRMFCAGKMPNVGFIPSDIPNNPNRIYCDQGWKSWGDWLGTGIISVHLRKYSSFEEARIFARSLGLKNVLEWRKFCKGQLPEKGFLPSHIPASPVHLYASEGWSSFSDWLGTANIASRKYQYRTFEEARFFARNLGLKSGKEWKNYCKGNLPEKGALPSDIPATPRQTYANDGWVSMGDWLGTGKIAASLKSYRQFEDARFFARNLGLKNKNQWIDFCKGTLAHLEQLPKDIPTNPNQTYANKGWMGYGDWLGSGTVATHLRKYRTFEQARAFARSLKLNSTQQWYAFCKGEIAHLGNIPQDIPVNPNQTYSGKGWIGFGDWLGKKILAPQIRNYRPFEQARAYAHTLGLKSGKEWSAFCMGELSEKGALPADIPASPQKVYFQDGWIGMADWLGNRNTNIHKHFRSFTDARMFVCSLKLSNRGEWRKFCKGELPQKGNLPADIPASPEKIYANNGWAGIGDWLGTGNTSCKNRNIREFQKARAFARSLRLKSVSQWRNYCTGKMTDKGLLPKDIPSSPCSVYKVKGWNGWSDWLGITTVATKLRNYRTFEEARDFARKLGLTNGAEWQKFCKGMMPEIGVLPADIPTCPMRTYAKDGWQGMGDWLGTGRIAKSKMKFRSFQEARAYVRSLKLKSHSEWNEYRAGRIHHLGSRPAEIPSNPNATYANKGWAGMADWLGTDNSSTSL